MMKKLVNVMTLVIALMALAGCGGGGGETSGYTGKSSAAALTPSNAYEMSIDVVDGLDSLSSLGSIAKAVPGSGQVENAIEPRALSDLLVRSITRSMEQPALAKTVAEAISGTEPGYAGSISYSGTADPATGRIAATFTFNNYQETQDSSILSGSISVSGTISVTRGGVDRITIVIPSLTVSVGGPDYGTFVTVKGRMTVVGGPEETMTLSMIFIGPNHETYWYKDFTYVDDGYSTAISGTFYHPLHGFVVVTTLVPLSDTLTAYGEPSSGQLLFTGSNGSKARLTFTGAGANLDLDADGTGTYTAIP